MQVQMVRKPNAAIFLDVDSLLGSVSLSRLEGKYHFDPINDMIRDVFTGEDSHTYRCKRCNSCSGKQIHLFKGTAINSLENLVRKIEKIANVRIVVSSTDQQKGAVQHLGCILYHRGFPNIVFNMDAIKDYQRGFEESSEKPNCDSRRSKIDKWIMDHSKYKGFLVFDEEYLLNSLDEKFTTGNQAVGNLNDIGDEFCKLLST